MNSKDSAVRRYIMQRADLLGAIRLPDTAFKSNAGTEVVTDILILKKRAANTDYSGVDFLEAPWSYPVKGSYSGDYISSYFTSHPEMVLGTPSFTGSMYRGNSLTYKAFTDRGSLADQIREAFKNIQGKMDYPAQQSPEKTNFAVERAGKKAKNNSLVVKDGKVYQHKDSELVEINTSKGTADRIAGMLEIRDAAKALQTYQQQGLKDSEIKKARQQLNKVYDAFVQKYGYINIPANRSAMKDDPDKFSIFALENYNPETKKGAKADIFFKNNYASYLLLALYVLVLAVNIITEVVKWLIPVPTDIVVFVVSIAVTLLALYIAASILHFTVMWYYAVGAVILGVFVAYAAMFGFDKFKELWDRLNAYGK